MIKDFKEFISRGNVIDMAVGIIIGAAFTGIVKSLVDDVIMPFIGLLTRGVDFSNLYLNLSGKEFESLVAAKAAGAATINYGLFINALFNFLIVAFVVFTLVKVINRLKRQAEAAPVVTPEEVILLRDIRDLLSKNQ